MSNDDYKVPEWVWVLAVMVIYYLLRKNSGEYVIAKPYVEIMVFGLLWSLGKYAFWYNRYFMPHVTVNNFSGSIGGRPQIVGDYAIFQCGEVFEPYHVKGKLATLVVRREHMKRAGRCYVGIPFVKRLPLLKLPPKVHSFLYHHQNEYNTDNIYFGNFSEEFLNANEKAILQELETQNYHSQINTRDRIIEGDNEMLEEQMETARSLGQKKDYFGFLRRKKNDDDE